MKIKSTLFLLFTLLCFEAQSQFEIGILNINKPPVMDSVLWRLRKLDSQHSQITGYRILIFQAIGRDANTKALETKSRFLNLFPQRVNEVELKYVYPRYEVVIGKYRERIDAYSDYKQIKRKFPNAIIIDAKFEKL